MSTDQKKTTDQGKFVMCDDLWRYVDSFLDYDTIKTANQVSAEWKKRTEQRLEDLYYEAWKEPWLADDGYSILPEYDDGYDSGYNSYDQ